MLISRIDPITDIENELELPVTKGDLRRIELGECPDAVLCKLRPWQRDFVITGVYFPPWLHHDNPRLYNATEG